MNARDSSSAKLSAVEEAASDGCWICGSRHSSVWKPRGIDRPLEPSDLAITDHRYGVTLKLLKCAECNFVFADGADVRELVSLYERLDDPEYEDTQDARRLQMEAVLALLGRAHPSAKTLLDIGAGAGLLVAAAIAKGYHAAGVEPSRALVSAARRINGVQLLEGVFPHPALQDRVFDAILLVDVIEHVSDPVALLRSCRDQLAPGGRIILITPDIGSVAARLLGQRWWHLRLAHVGYFDRQTLDRAVRRAGLRPLHWSRAKWYFRVGYLADRLAEYLPLGGLNRLLRRGAGGAMNSIIPLNLYDSWVCVLSHDE